MATKTTEAERGNDGKFHHPCGESFTHAGWYTKHALKCSGQRAQTRGRIDRLAARRDGAARRASRETKIDAKALRAATAPRDSHPDRTPPEASMRDPVHSARDLLLEELLAKREKLDAAIATLQAIE
jgi:hypothetical protein